MSFEKVPAQPIASPLRAGKEAAPQLGDDPGRALRELIATIRRRWACALGVTVAVVFLTLCYLVMVRPIYTASAQILVDPAGQRNLQNNNVTTDGLPPDGAIAFAENQLRLLESDGVLRRVVVSEGLTSDPAFVGEKRSFLSASIHSFASVLGLGLSEPETKELQALRKLRESVSAERAGKALVIDVLVSSHDRQKSARLANAIADAYLAEQADVRAETARQTTADLTARLADLREELRQAEESVQAYKFRHNTVTAPNGLVPLSTNQALVGLHELEHNVEASRAVYQSFLTRARQTAAEGALGGYNARVISQATPPIKRSWPPGGLLALSLAVGLCLGTGVAVARDSLDGRIHTRRQLDASSVHPIIAVIPHLTPAASIPRLFRDLAQLKQPTPHEIFFLLRDVLRANEPERTRTVLLITSSCGEEGKSTIALNLAVAAMMDGERVLLIDADFKAQAISRQLAAEVSGFGRPGRPAKDLAGLGDILKDSCTLDASVNFPVKSKFAVLPAGCPEGLGSRVERADLVGKVLSKVKEFNLIVIDGGSAKSGRLVRNLSAVADEIILVVRAGRSRREDVDSITATLGDAARIRGVVFNEAEW
jgi:uncharacterized protein involved in exopolysaccharide biosynthesis/Mrp family chromosome partitioning ATPase